MADEEDDNEIYDYDGVGSEKQLQNIIFIDREVE